MILYVKGFKAGNSSMQNQGCNLDAFGDELCNQLWRKGTACRGHFSASHLCDIDRLVVASRPTLLDITIANREAILCKVILQWTADVQCCNPQPDRSTGGE